MTQKLGGAEKVAGAQAHLHRLGLPDGIQFRFGGWIGNTMRAHQLILWSELHDGQQGSNSSSSRSATNTTSAVVEAIFRAHFEDERDISNVETLLQIAEQASPGLDVGRVRAWLETGQGVAEIERMAEQAREEGIRGVPYFQMGDGGMTLNGAQDVEEFFRSLVAYKEGQRASATTAREAGNSC
jgi:predicted DsbA family dithiol-disulfide isomerase